MASRYLDAACCIRHEVQRLVDGHSDEGLLQRHLETNPAILRLAFSGSTVKVKQRLGAALVTDFVIRQADCTLLVEIESTRHEILNNKGDLRSEITHAIGQVESWIQWTEDNLGEERDTGLDGGARFQGVVIVGHTKGFDREERRLIGRRTRRNEIEFLSWDQFIERARAGLRAASQEWQSTLRMVDARCWTG